MFQWLEQAVLAPHVIVFLKEEAGAARQLQTDVAGWPGVQSANFVSKEEALARLREDLKDNPGAFEDLQMTALPGSIEIAVSGTEAARAVVERLKKRPEVDEVPWTTIGDQFDTMLAWLKSHARPAAAGTTPTPSNSAISLSSEEEKRLDRLDAAGVAKTYFDSGDSAVEYYLSGPWLREVTSQPNFVPEHEREGGIDDLVVEGPFFGVPSQVYNVAEWHEQVHFRVTYTSRTTDSIGQPPGKRLWFVTVGRRAADSP